MGDNSWRNLFTQKELEWFLKLGSAMTSPEEKKAFFEDVVETKRADPSWDFFSKYPRKREKFPGHEICAEIIEMLRGRGQKNVG